MSIFDRVLKAFSDYVFEFLLWVLSLPIFPVFSRRVLLRGLGVDVGVGCYINHNVCLNRRNIVLGDYCAFSKGVYLDGSGELLIGDRVHVGSNSLILTATHNIMPSVYRRDRCDNRLEKTEIQRGVWLGAGVVVLPGVRIGEGCVVGAGSVVVKDCMPNGLYVGVPATRVKDLPVKTNNYFYNGVEVIQ